MQFLNGHSIILGSGFSGLCAAIQLKQQLNIKATVFEAAGI